MRQLHFQPSEIFRYVVDKVFNQQKQKILEYLPFVQIEHIGGTSICGMITKGDLDINIRVYDKDFNKSVEVLKKIYEINQPTNWTRTYASFKDENNLEIDFGVQLTVIGSRDDYFVKQRDLLIKNPDLVKELNQIKTYCELENLSMDEYRRIKGKFFEKIVL